MTGATTVGTASTTKQIIPPASLAAKAEPGKIATATQAASQKEVPTKQLVALPGTKTAASPSATATNGTGKKPCVILTKTLTVGSKSPEVVALKKFLSDQKLLTGVTMTDYFGAQTAEALKKWQKNNKIVSSGTAATTGYGATGVKTRKALGTCK
jgi:peptidoglycan hydrolase-like protein with peptidoglycan-binding domain